MLELVKKEKEHHDGGVFDWEGQLPTFRTQREMNLWIEEHRYEDVINPFAFYGIQHTPDPVTKMNPGIFSSGDLSGSYEWGSPQKLFDEKNAQHWYDVDLAASCLNAKLPVYLGPNEAIIEEYIRLNSEAKKAEGAVRKQYKEEASILLRENGCDSLQIPWHQYYRCGWLNPPYGNLCGDFVRKAYEEVNAGMKCITMLLPARTDTEWFHAYIKRAMDNFSGGTRCSTTWIKGRLAFEVDGVPTGTAPFPSMLCHFYRHMSPYTQGGM